MVFYCCVKGCTNNSKKVKIDQNWRSFHVFPIKQDLRQKWLRGIGRQAWSPPNHARICSAHFSTDSITQCKDRTTNNEDACPDFDLPPNPNFEASDIEVCRICLATDVKLFNLDIGPLEHCTESIATYKDSGCCDVEGLPRFVCYECASHLLKLTNFIEKSVTAQAVLLDIFAENAQITTSLVKKQASKQLNLQSTLSSHNVTPCHFFEYEYSDEENTSSLKNKYFAGIKQELMDIKQKGAQDSQDSQDLLEEYMSTETRLVTKLEDPTPQDEDYYEMEYLSENEIDEKVFLISPRSSNDDTKFEDDKVIKMELDESLQKEENTVDKRKKNEGATKKRKLTRNRPIQIYRLTHEERLMQKHFIITTLSEEEQIDEWNEMVRENMISKRNYTCEVCFKWLPTLKLYKTHIACHDPERGTLECPVCKVRFGNKKSLYKHRNCTHKVTLQCKICPKVYKSATVAKNHHLRHAGHVYSCPDCEFTSKHRSKFADHKRTQHAHAHDCVRCGHAFVSDRGLAYHVRVAHRGDEKTLTSPEFRCEECGIDFVTEEARRVHVLTSVAHRMNCQREPILDDPSLKTTCKQCGSKFGTKLELQLHCRTEHGTQLKRPSTEFTGDTKYPTRCDHCDLKVDTRKEHWAHVRKQHRELIDHYRPEINAICETCGKGFQTVFRLRLHELRHKSPSVSCETCGRLFYDKYALANHQVQHEALYQHVCRICGRAFTLKGNLYRHQRVHTKETPYECKQCGKRFRYSDSVKLHIRTVHQKLPYPPRAPRKRQRPAAQRQSTTLVDD